MKLRNGDTVRHVSNPTPYIVHGKAGKKYIIVSVKKITKRQIERGEWIKA